MVRELSVLQKKLSNYKSIAIITARGGSKRIPKKNIKEFCGKPIIAYSIKAAIDSKIFDEVMVSTDSKEIAEIAKKYGASVPFMRVHIYVLHISYSTFCHTPEIEKCYDYNARKKS